MRRVNTLSAATVAGSTPGNQNIANQIIIGSPDDVYLLPSSRQAFHPNTNATQDNAAPTIRNPQLTQRQVCSRFDDKRPPGKIITIPAHARHPATSADGISIGLPISPLAEVSIASPPPKKSPNVARQHGRTKASLTSHLPSRPLPLSLVIPPRPAATGSSLPSPIPASPSPALTDCFPSPAGQLAARARRRPGSRWPTPARSWRPVSTPPNRHTPARCAAG